MQSSSKGAATEGTQVELPGGNKLMSTWHDEIFELPFALKSPEKATTYMVYSSNAVPVTGIANHTISITTKLEKKNYGLFVELQKVIVIVY